MRYNKYKAKRTYYDGRWYDSKREAQKAQELDLLKKAGEVLDWKPQPKIELIPKPYQILYYPDFWVKYKDGHEEYVDVKGVRTHAFAIKERLFGWRFPHLRLIVET